jgi:hypothetical protein
MHTSSVRAAPAIGRVGFVMVRTFGGGRAPFVSLSIPTEVFVLGARAVKARRRS